MPCARTAPALPRAPCSAGDAAPPSLGYSTGLRVQALNRRAGARSDPSRTGFRSSARNFRMSKLTRLDPIAEEFQRLSSDDRQVLETVRSLRPRSTGVDLPLVGKRRHSLEAKRPRAGGPRLLLRDGIWRHRSQSEGLEAEDGELAPTYRNPIHRLPSDESATEKVDRSLRRPAPRNGPFPLSRWRFRRRRPVRATVE